MVKFQFPLRDPAGLSPEAAVRLVKEAIGCTGRVQIRKGEKSGDAKLIFHVLSLSARAGDMLEIQVEGEHEKEEAARLEAYIKEYL